MSQQTLSQQDCEKSLFGHKDLRYETVLSLLAAPNGEKIGKISKAINKRASDNMLKSKSVKRGWVMYAVYPPDRQMCYCYVDLGEPFSLELFDVPAAASLFKPVRSVIACIFHIKTPCITCMTQIWHTPREISARLDPNTFSCFVSCLLRLCELFRKWLWWKGEGIIRMWGWGSAATLVTACLVCQCVFLGSRCTQRRLWGLHPLRKWLHNVSPPLLSSYTQRYDNPSRHLPSLTPSSHG